MQWTIDELAARSGISVRTIRFYAGKGLIPPPQLRGRTGLYGEDHLARLELVSELSGLGFTLAAIEGFLERIPPSAGAAELVLQRALLTPWVSERAEEVDRAELGRPARPTTAASASGCTTRSAAASRCSTSAGRRTCGSARTSSSSSTPPRSPRT
jgi:DNA-binding transcriptional MerR regulator